MLVNSSTFLQYSQPETSAQDYAQAHLMRQPSLVESVGASAGVAFDRATSWVDVIRGEEKDWMARQSGGQIFNNIQEFESDPDWVPGMEWSPGMSKARLQYMRQNWNDRRDREETLEAASRNGIPYVYGAGNFIAGMVGSLPDPVNVATMLIPIPGLTALKTVGMSGKQLLRQSLRPSVVGLTAGGNLASSMYAAYDLNPMGENITWNDIMMDTLVGTVVGVGFHAGGSILRRSSSRTALRNQIQGLADEIPDIKGIQEGLAGMRRGDTEAYRTWGQHFETGVQEMFAGQNVRDAVRMKLTAMDRAYLALSMEKAMSDVAYGAPVDNTVMMQNPKVHRVYQDIMDYSRELGIRQNENAVTVRNVKDAQTAMASLAKEVEANFTAIANEVKTPGELDARTRGMNSRMQELTTALNDVIALRNEKAVNLYKLREIKNNIEAMQTELVPGAKRATADDVKALRMAGLADPRKAAALDDLNASLLKLKHELQNIETRIVSQLEEAAPWPLAKVDQTPVLTERPDTIDEGIVSKNLPRAQELINEGLDPTTGISRLEAYMRENGMLDAETLTALEATRKTGDFLNRADAALKREPGNKVDFLSCILVNIGT